MEGDYQDNERCWKCVQVLHARWLAGNIYKCRICIGKDSKFLEDYRKEEDGISSVYFLSNDELLEILAQTRDPHAVQPHVSKCFDAIKSLVLADLMYPETARP